MQAKTLRTCKLHKMHEELQHQKPSSNFLPKEGTLEAKVSLRTYQNLVPEPAVPLWHPRSLISQRPCRGHGGSRASGGRATRRSIPSSRQRRRRRRGRGSGGRTPRRRASPWAWGRSWGRVRGCRRSRRRSPRSGRGGRGWCGAAGGTAPPSSVPGTGPRPRGAAAGGGGGGAGRGSPRSSGSEGERRRRGRRSRPWGLSYLFPIKRRGSEWRLLTVCVLWLNPFPRIMQINSIYT